MEELASLFEKAEERGSERAARGSERAARGSERAAGMRGTELEKRE